MLISLVNYVKQKKREKGTNKNETNYLCGEIFALFLR